MIGLLWRALQDWRRNMSFLFGHKRGEVKVVMARLVFLVSGFGFRVRNGNRGCKNQTWECGEQIRG
jgi:hypothetical protein